MARRGDRPTETAADPVTAVTAAAPVPATAAAAAEDRTGQHPVMPTIRQAPATKVARGPATKVARGPGMLLLPEEGQARGGRVTIKTVTAAAAAPAGLGATPAAGDRKRARHAPRTATNKCQTRGRVLPLLNYMSELSWGAESRSHKSSFLTFMHRKTNIRRSLPWPESLVAGSSTQFVQTVRLDVCATRSFVLHSLAAFPAWFLSMATAR